MIKSKIVQASDLSFYPYNCIGWITIRGYTNNVVNLANGFLISPNLVLTSANFFLRSQIKNVSSLYYYTSFSLAQKNKEGQIMIKIKGIKLHPKISQSKNKIQSLKRDLKIQSNQVKKDQISDKIKQIYRQSIKFNFAILQLQKDIEKIRYLDCWQTVQPSSKITVSGYIQNQLTRQFQHWTHKGTISQIKDGAAFYSIDTMQAEIGAPAYLEIGDSIILIGINQGISQVNQSKYCVLITEELIANLKSLNIKDINLKKQKSIVDNNIKFNKPYFPEKQDKINNQLVSKPKIIQKNSGTDLILRANSSKIYKLENNQFEDKKYVGQHYNENGKLQKQIQRLTNQNNQLIQKLKETQNKLKMAQFKLKQAQNKIKQGQNNSKAAQNKLKTLQNKLKMAQNKPQDIYQLQNKLKQYQQSQQYRLKDILMYKNQIRDLQLKDQRLEEQTQKKDLTIKELKQLNNKKTIQIDKLKKRLQQLENRQTQYQYKNYKNPKQKQLKPQDNIVDNKIKSQIDQKDYAKPINQYYNKNNNLTTKIAKDKDSQFQKQFGKPPTNKKDQNNYDQATSINKQKNNFNLPQFGKTYSKNQDKYTNNKQYLQNKVQQHKNVGSLDKYKQKKQYPNYKAQITKKQIIGLDQLSKTNQLKKKQYRQEKLNQIKKQSNILKRRQLKIQFASQAFQRGYNQFSTQLFEIVPNEIQAINNKTFEDEDNLAYAYAFLSNLCTIKKDDRFQDFSIKAQNIYKKNPNIYFEEIITLKNNRAYAYQNINKANVAITIYNQVLQLQNQFYSINDERRLSTLNNLFCLYFQNDIMKGAQAVLKQIRPILATINTNTKIYQICQKNHLRYKQKTQK